MTQTPETAAASGPAIGQSPASISFVVTVPDRRYRAPPNLATIRSRLHDGDEVIVLTGAEPAEAGASAESWYSVVTSPEPGGFSTRAQTPAICRNDWVVMIEDHALIEPRAIDAIRELIRANPDLDMIVMWAKNLTSVTRWGWAIFLFNYALIWAPNDRRPPFSSVTSAIVRRAKFETEMPLKEGVWELQLIPKIYSEGKFAYSNEIFFDHVKPATFVSAVVLAFHNARTGAAVQRTLGVRRRTILHEGWHCARRRPQVLAKAVAHRLDELPAGTFRRVSVVSYAHLIGYIAGIMFGGGRSAHKI
jgi:hypothetical protein